MNLLKLDTLWWNMHQIYITEKNWTNKDIKDGMRKSNLRAAFSVGVAY